ncbi:Spermidine/putrescine-binding periplasmic protein [Roseobacter sp. SK209-2-6]|nr:Spermidine/putrescine-binding periplasmic protein [Roseobacter sp. SK209-2-6]
MWSDYLPPEFIAGFEAKTGIKVNYTGIGSNEEIINKMKATKGQGFDIVSPTNNRSLQWGPLELLKPFDMNKVNISAVNPAMAKIGTDAWNFDMVASIGCHISGAPKALPIAPINGCQRAMHLLTVMSGRRKMLARPWAGRTR